ncbi:hypothetical protein XENTR_v10019939 [Xenopus tropicalis]|nr:hypothetical protein XENTR_v10019939 [Xenopus tropicalis]
MCPHWRQLLPLHVALCSLMRTDSRAWEPGTQGTCYGNKSPPGVPRPQMASVKQTGHNPAGLGRSFCLCRRIFGIFHASVSGFCLSPISATVWLLGSILP